MQVGRVDFMRNFATFVAQKINRYSSSELSLIPHAYGASHSLHADSSADAISFSRIISIDLSGDLKLIAIDVEIRRDGLRRRMAEARRFQFNLSAASRSQSTHNIPILEAQLPLEPLTIDHLCRSIPKIKKANFNAKFVASSSSANAVINYRGGGFK
jgi:hypothetical protein